MHRVPQGELRDALAFARMMLRAEMAERSFLGKTIQYRDTTPDLATIARAQIALRSALAGGIYLHFQHPIG